ncbi:MAG TPA: carboxyl transferase domain-containing protein [Usitatibacter sp.]|nr:carboxyl transferase domain-containing protein [Usitatibacter sp.]
MSDGGSLLEALKAAVGFEPAAERVGNLTLGGGRLDARAMHVALVENFVASGSLGQAECERLAAIFDKCAQSRTPLVMYIDSAGARVSEGLRALGGFRLAYGAGLRAALAGAPIAAVLGRNCFGGASMLAHLAPKRLLGPNTQMAMSGPAVIAAASGMNALDEAFRAMAAATFSPTSRASACAANSAWEPGADVAAWLRDALEPPADRAASFRRRHDELRSRLDASRDEPVWKVVRRDELARLFPACESRECDGVVAGEGGEGAREAFVGFVDNKPVDAARAWRFSEIVWRHASEPPRHLEVLLDSASHAARLDEERRILTEFVVDAAAALAALAARGTRVGLTVTGRAGGGIYVALAAPAQRVRSVYARARIEVLPGSAVAAILGESRDDTPTFGEYRSAGVADEELKLGFVPGNA